MSDKCNFCGTDLEECEEVLQVRVFGTMAIPNDFCSAKCLSGFYK